MIFLWKIDDINDKRELQVGQLEKCPSYD